jgi:methionine synthase II (cobalamin-independent)
MLETTIAGSLPKPAWLAEPEQLWATWRYAGAELERAKQDAALVWLKEQEAAGIDVVSDGEQFRVHFVHGFLERIEGIDWTRKTTREATRAPGSGRQAPGRSRRLRCDPRPAARGPLRSRSERWRRRHDGPAPSGSGSR